MRAWTREVPVSVTIREMEAQAARLRDLTPREAAGLLDLVRSSLLSVPVWHLDILREVAHGGPH